MERAVPATETQPHKSCRGLYRVRDPFVPARIGGWWAAGAQIDLVGVGEPGDPASADGMPTPSGTRCGVPHAPFHLPPDRLRAI